MNILKKALFLVALVASQQAIAGSLQGMESLTGTWKLAEPKSEDDAAFRLTYRLISRDSALVELYGDPKKQPTETVFHADGDTVMATHYCARGNQPRLRTKKLSAEGWVEFDFVDVTNLANKLDPHMVKMRFKLIDNNHFVKEETYLVNNVERTSSMSLVREH